MRHVGGASQESINVRGVHTRAHSYKDALPLHMLANDKV